MEMVFIVTFLEIIFVSLIIGFAIAACEYVKDKKNKKKESNKKEEP